MNKSLELMKQIFLDRFAVAADVEISVAYHPTENRRLKNGDLVKIDLIDMAHGQVYFAWKCDPNHERSNSIFGENWNAMPASFFEDRPYDPPFDWRVNFEKTIPNC